MFEHDKFPVLIKVHSILMVVSWLVLRPLAIAVMRYFKHLGSFVLCVHLRLNTFSMVVALVAFTMAAVQGSHANRVHRAMDWTVIVLVALQIMSSVSQPEERTSCRKLWFLMHMTFGVITVCMAWGNIFVGLKVMNAEISFFDMISVEMLAGSLFSALFRECGLLKASSSRRKGHSHKRGHPEATASLRRSHDWPAEHVMEWISC